MFIHKWIHNGTPDIIWLPGIFNVKGFLTSLKQDYAKYKSISYREVDLHWEVTKFDDTSHFNEDWSAFFKVRNSSVNLFSS